MRAFRKRLGTLARWVVVVAAAVAIHFMSRGRDVVYGTRWIVATIAINLVDLLALFVAWRLSIRFPIGRQLPRWHIAPHALAAMTYAVVNVVMSDVIAPALDPANNYGLRSVQARVVIALVIYAVAAAVAHGIEYVRRYRASRSAELRLRAELADAARARAEAEFRALKAEMDPQRMSEVLGRVGLLVANDPDEAERSVVRLGDMLRDTISRRGDDEPALEDEDAEIESPPQADGTARGRRNRGILLAAFFLVNLGAGLLVNIGATTRSGARVPLHGAIFESLLYAPILTAELYVVIRIVRGSSQRLAWRAHLVAALIFGVVAALARVLLAAVIGLPYRMPTLRFNVYRAVGGALQYGVLAAVVAAFEYARRYASAEASALALRAQLADAARQRAEARLRALKLELNPHFLGNALATVAALIRTDPAGAQRVVAQLDATLRDAIARVGVQEVPLAEEIDGLAPFLAVERARFGERLAVSWDVEDEARLAYVPHMILQPLIENAVKHGLSAREGSGHIVVAGRRMGDRLELSVRDDGIGISRSPRTRGTGVGLANTRARLEQLYGPEARLELIPAPGSGTIARVSLPWR